MEVPERDLKRLRLFECQDKLLYSLIVAGKSAAFANTKMGALFGGYKMLPFDEIRDWIKTGKLEKMLRTCKTGNYRKLTRAFTELVNTPIDFETCTPEDLEKIHGVGPKTSRFFLIWIRPKEKYAALDGHILRWMRSLGYDAPKSTPSGRKYAELEKAFLKEAEKRGKTPRQLDEEIWLAGSTARNITPRPA